MKRTGLTNEGFWRSAAATAATLTGLAALVWAAPILYATRHGQGAAKMICLAGSRVMLYNPGVTGYYERLFGWPHPMFMSVREFDAWAKGVPDYIYGRTFRIRRYRPNLKDFHYKSQPQGLTTNSFGFLGPERSLRKPPHTRRVALLGDSLSQGWGVDQNLSYVSLLEKRLNAAPSDGSPQNFEVLNFASGGYNLTQMLDLAEEDIPRFEPDLYVLALTELAVFKNWDEHFAWMIHLGIDPKYDFLRDAVRHSGASSEDTPLAILGKLAPFRVPVIKEIIRRIQERAAHDHARFVVLLVPALEDGDMNWKRFGEVPELLASLAVPVVDLRDTFDGILNLEPLRINPFDVHPNVRGHAMILENLYSKLRARPDLWAALTGTDL